MADGDQAAYDDVADVYDHVLDPEGVALVDPVLQELIGNVAGLEVLSLACGQGRDARLLASLGATVTGVDASMKMLGNARRHEATNPRGIAFVEGDAQDLAGFDHRAFDGVVCHMALMDIPALAPTIGSVARVLRAGGWFVFSIVHPCYRGHVEIVTDYLLDHRYRKPLPIDWLPAYAYHRPLGTYVNELTQAGLGIVRMAEVHHTPAEDGDVPRLLYARAVKVRS